MAADIDELFTVAPEEFVATRNGLAKELRAGGVKDEAAAVAALRRPTVSDWALNVVAHRHPDAVASLVDTAAELRRIQAGAIEGRGGDVRSALTDMRAAATAVQRLADEVLTEAGRDRGPQAAGLTSRLAEVAANEAVADQLRAGRLGTAPVEDTDPFAGLQPATLPPRPAKPAKKAAPQKPAAAQAAKEIEPEKRPPPTPDPARRRRLEKAAADARKVLSAAEAGLARAQARVDEATAAVERADDDLARG
ncbi:MAG TPA: hypothetical protein VKD67_14130 [Acidimicrobiales bacterium]|nr:hypothetical protein [Acidimicrobiales bacterium]